MSLENARLRVGGQTFRLEALRIESRFEDGSPEILRVIKADQNAELSEDVTKNCFIVAWVPDMDYSDRAGEIPTI